MASDNELLIRLGVDASDAKKQITEVNKELKSLQTQIKNNDDATSGYNKTQDGLNKQLSLQHKALDALNTKLSTQQTVYNNCRTELEKRKKALSDLQQSENATKKEINDATRAVEISQRQLNDAQRDIDKTKSEIDKMERSISKTQEQLRQFNAEVEKTSTLKSFQTWLTTTGTHLQTMGDKLMGLGKKITTVSATLTPLTYGIIRGFKSAYQVFGELETSLAEVGAISGFTAEQMEVVNQVAKDLGAEMPLSSGDVADAFKYMSLAGLTYEQQMEAIETVTKASIAWNMDLADSTDLITDAMSACGEETENWTEILDLVTQAQNNSNATAGQFLEAYLEVGSMLSGFNVPLKESISFLGLLANRGVKGAEAGRALSAILTNMTGGNKKATEALKELGVEVFNAEGEFLGLETVLVDYYEATKDMTDEQKNMYATMIAGKTRSSEFRGLIAGIGEEYETLSGKIEGSANALEKTYEKMMDTTGNMIENIKGSLESIGIKFIESIEEPFKIALESIDKLLQKIYELPEEYYVIFGIISGILALIAPIGLAIGATVTGIGVFIKTIGSIFNGISAVLGFIASPIGLIVTAIAGLVAGLIYAYKHSEKFRDVVNKAWESIKETVKKVVDFIKPYIEKFIDWLPGAWDTATKFLSDVWIGLIDTVIDVFGAIKDFILKFWGKHGDTITDVFNRMWDNAKETWKTLKETAETVFNGLKDFWDEWGDEISTFFSVVWGNMKKGWEIAWNAIKMVVDIATTGITNALKVFFQILDGDFEGAWDTIKTTTETVWGILKEFIVDSVGKIWEAIKTGFGWIKDNAPTIWGAFVDFVVEKATQMKDWVVEKVSEIVPKIGEFLSELPGKVYDWLCQVLPKIWDWGVEMKNKVVEALFGEGGFVEQIGTSLAELPGKFYDWLCEVLPKLWDWGVDLRDKAVEALTGEGGFFDGLQTTLNELPDKFLEWLDGVLPNFDTWKTNLITKVDEVINGEGGFLAKIDELLGGDGTSTGLPATFKKWFDETMTKLTSWKVEDLIPEGEEIAKKFIDAVDMKLKDLPEKFAYWLGESLRLVVEWGIDLWKKGYEAVWGENGLIAGVVQGLKDLPKKIAEWLGLGTDEVDDWKPDLEKSGSNAGTGLSDSVISKVSSLLPPGLKDALQAGLLIIDWFKGQGESKGSASGTSISEKIKSTIMNLLPPGMQAGFELALKAIDSFKTNGSTKGASGATSIIKSITSTLGGLPSKVFTIGVQAGESLGKGLASVSSWVYSKAKGVWDSFMSGLGGKDSGILTLQQEYETDAITGQPNTVWNYGKDYIKTVSLSDFKDTGSYANSSLISNNSYSQNYLNAYRSNSVTSTHTNANDSLSNKLDLLIDLLMTQQQNQGDTYITVDAKDKTPQELMRMLDNYMKPRSKKW